MIFEEISDLLDDYLNGVESEEHFGFESDPEIMNIIDIIYEDMEAKEDSGDAIDRYIKELKEIDFKNDLQLDWNCLATTIYFENHNHLYSLFV